MYAVIANISIKINHNNEPKITTIIPIKSAVILPFKSNILNFNDSINNRARMVAVIKIYSTLIYTAPRYMRKIFDL